MKMYPKTFSGQPAVQVESELKSFINFLIERGVKSYLEIGTARGDTFHEIVSHLPHGSKAMAVDLPQACWGLENSNKYLDAVVADLKKTHDVSVLYGASTMQEIIDVVGQNGPFDCIFIDGDHTLQGVMADWENYGWMGKIVAFHDITDTMRPNRVGEKIEVPIFWNNLKQLRKHVEFIEENSTMGIGVVINAD